MTEHFSYPDVAKVNPKAAILVMFSNLEGLLKRTYAHTYPDERPPGTMAKLTKDLRDKGVIDQELSDRLDELRRRRNIIAHKDPNIGEEVAVAYYDLLGTALVELTRTSLYR